MNDRELLELAAKAAGIPVSWEPAHNCHWISLGHGLEHKPWNPLQDDGDAFGLMVRLGLDVQFSPEAVEVVAHQHARLDGKEAVAPWAWESLLNLRDPTIAARRAVVRAAAAIDAAAGKV